MKQKIKIRKANRNICGYSIKFFSCLWFTSFKRQLCDNFVIFTVFKRIIKMDSNNILVWNGILLFLNNKNNSKIAIFH